MTKDQQVAAQHAGKQRLQANVDVGQGLRMGSTAKPNNQKQSKGNSAAQQRAAGSHLYSEDHEHYHFEDDDDGDNSQAMGLLGTAGRDEKGSIQHTASGQQTYYTQQDSQLSMVPGDHGLLPAGSAKGPNSIVTKNLNVGSPGVILLNRDAKGIQQMAPPPTSTHQVLMTNMNAPQQKIGTQDQIVIKNNNVYLHDASDGLSDMNHLGKLVATTGAGNQGLKQMLKTNSMLNDADIVI